MIIQLSETKVWVCGSWERDGDSHNTTKRKWERAVGGRFAAPMITEHGEAIMLVLSILRMEGCPPLSSPFAFFVFYFPSRTYSLSPWALYYILRRHHCRCLLMSFLLLLAAAEKFPPLVRAPTFFFLSSSFFFSFSAPLFSLQFRSSPGELFNAFYANFVEGKWCLERRERTQQMNNLAALLPARRISSNYSD